LDVVAWCRVYGEEANNETADSEEKLNNRKHVANEIA
jgi:hypothetical protein